MAEQQIDAPAPELVVGERLCWFWMVWAENGRSPMKAHHTEESAFREARRLARKVPGQRFFVLQAKRGFKCKGARSDG